RVRALTDQAKSVRPPELAPVADASGSYSYRVGPGDVLQIVVFDHPELTNPTGDSGSLGQEVRPGGTIYYPFIGELVVAGLTPAQIRTVVAQRLSQVLQNPQVDVRILSYRSQSVQVTGEVAQPGRVYITSTPKGLLDAIAERGDLAPGASRQSLRLVRG